MSDSPAEKTLPDHSLMAKAVAGVFATVLAPVLVAFGVKYSDSIVEKITTQPAAAKSDLAPKDAGKAGAGAVAILTQPVATADSSIASIGKPDASAVTTPQSAPGKNVAMISTAGVATGGGGVLSTDRPAEATKIGEKNTPPAFQAVGPVVRLFNLKDFSGWHKHVNKTSTSNVAPPRNVDPDGVFKVANGMVCISGQYFGTLTTDKEFENYHLTVEFKWGTTTWREHAQQARKSGVLLHGGIAEGAHMGWAPQSINCQIVEGRIGDLLCYNVADGTAVNLMVEATVDLGPAKKRKTPLVCYKPGEPLTTISQGSVRRLGNGADWRDVLDFHRPDDIEKPTGEWNTLECLCQGDRITVLLNGKVVNEAVNVTPSRGKISLQSHAAEIFFRKVELQTLAAR